VGRNERKKSRDEEFCVIDNGPGMTREELESNLDLFVRDSSEVRNHGVGGKGIATPNDGSLVPTESAVEENVTIQ
jgi:hypothetical protein